MASSQVLDEYLETFRIWLRDAGFVQTSQYNPMETWGGEVTVEWKEEKSGSHQSAKHIILILLPEGFPYNTPIVISQDNPPLKPSWHLNPQPLSSLCLWQSENGWQPHFTAQHMLNRIRDWFYCYHTDKWPEDSEMPDLFAYLENVGLVVTGEDWTPPIDTVCGKFTLWQRKGFGEKIHGLASTAGDGKSIILELPEKRLSLFVDKEKDTLRLTGVWFRLDKPFVPSNNLSELFNSIDQNLRKQTGWAVEQCVRSIGKTLPSGITFPIALGYKDRSSLERWLFLQAAVPITSNKKHKVPWSRSQDIKLTSFRTAPAKEADLLRRTAHISDSLKQRKAIVFGVGALGSSIALLLAKTGFGELRLVDSDTLMPGNIIRHVCGLNFVGSEKIYATAVTISTYNPDCLIRPYQSTWEVSKLQEYLQDCDVVIDATANSNFSLHLNGVCIDLCKPIIFTSAYRRAKIGKIIIRRNANDPCFACYVDPQFWSPDEYPIVPPAPQETFIEDGCGSVTQEATALDIEAVANLTVRVAIKLVQQKLENNLGIIVNEGLVDTVGMLNQEGVHWRLNTPLKSCQICGD